MIEVFLDKPETTRADDSVQAPELSGGGIGDATRPGAVRLKDITYLDGYEWLADHACGWQYGESGILHAMVKQLDISHGFAVEFGIGTELTCKRLFDEGWSGLLIDGFDQPVAMAKHGVGYGWPTVDVVKHAVGIEGEDRLDSIFKSRPRRVPESPDLMVADIDSYDYYVWKELKEYTPKIVMIEHHDLTDSSRLDNAWVPPADECGLKKNGYFTQVGVEDMAELAKQKGYTPVCITRLNSIFVINSLAEKLKKAPVVEVAENAIRLNIGAGDKNMEGYTAFDIKNGDDATGILPYQDGTVDEIYASHVLEHINPRKIPAVLVEWARVLKPGGIMRIAVPDMDAICRDRTPENEWLFDLFIYGGNTDENDHHRWGFSERTLARVMHNAGIGHIQRFEAFNDDCSKIKQSLNLEGRKRWWPKIENPRVSLVLSQPRLCFTDHATRLIDLAYAMKFERCLYGGAFWDRDIELGTKKAIESHRPDIVLYSDYDSVFHPQDALTLIDTLQNCPEVAAVTCVQMSRHNDEPLVFMPDRDYSGPVTRVDFGHFGLTAIRADVFKELPSPWFWSMPGRSDENKPLGWDAPLQSDADITFWRMLKEYGFPVLQRNDVIIGHMVLCAKWPAKSPGGFSLQPMESYNKVGKPSSAVFDAQTYITKRGVSISTSQRLVHNGKPII